MSSRGAKPEAKARARSKRDDGAVHASDESDVVGVDTRHAAYAAVAEAHATSELLILIFTLTLNL